MLLFSQVMVEQPRKHQSGNCTTKYQFWDRSLRRKI